MTGDAAGSALVCLGQAVLGRIYPHPRAISRGARLWGLISCVFQASEQARGGVEEEAQFAVLLGLACPRLRAQASPKRGAGEGAGEGLAGENELGGGSRIAIA